MSKRPYLFLSSLLRVWVLIAAWSVAESSLIQAASCAQSTSTSRAPKALAAAEIRRIDVLEKTIGELRRSGKFAEAIAPSEEILAICLRSLGEEHWQSSDARRRVETLKRALALPTEGRTAMAQADFLDEKRSQMEKAARFVEGERIAREVLAIREKWLGPSHVETAAAANKLAVVLLSEEKNAEAERLFKRVLAIRRETLGLIHPLTGRSYNNLSALSYYQDRYPEAEAAARQALDITRNALGPDHADIADCLNNLGNSLDLQGKHVEAEEIYRHSLQIYLKTRGPDHLETAEAFNNLASTLDSIGKSAEAETYLRKALTIFRKELAPNHPQIALGLRNLAENLSDQGRNAEAETFYREALAVCLQSRGPIHADTAGCTARLAVALYEQSKYAEAEKVCKEAIAAWTKLVGPNKPITVQCYGNLAAILSNQARYAEAEAMHRKVLDIRLKSLNPDNSDIAVAYNNLGLSLREQGSFAEAVTMLRKALAIFMKSSGPNHPDTANASSNLGFAVSCAGGYDEGEALCRKALDTLVASKNPNQIYTSQVCSNLASILNERGKYAESESMSRRALEIRFRLLAPDHSLTARNYNDLTLSLRRQGKHAEAEVGARKALAIWLKTLGPAHPFTAAGYGNLALCLNAQGKHAEAEGMARTSLAIELEAEDPNRPGAGSAESYGILAACLCAQGKYAEAEAMDRNALAIDEKTRGADHPETANDYNSVGACLISQGKFSEAEPMVRRALSILIKSLGPDHPDLIVPHGNLGMILDARGRLEEAVGNWRAAVNVFESSRPATNAISLERFLSVGADPRPFLAVTLARLGHGRDAYQSWESGLARGLLDSISARELRPLTADQRREELNLLNQLHAVDEEIGKLGYKPDRNQADDTRLDILNQRRSTLGGSLVVMERSFQDQYRAFAGRSASLEEIRASLPAGAALLSWLDVKHPGPHDRDASAYHWACVVRRASGPVWVKLRGSGTDQAWTEEDNRLPDALKRSLLAGTPSWRAHAAALAKQRLVPLQPHLQGVEHWIVLPSPALAGIPVEVLITAQPSHAPRPIVSYAPSGSIFARLSRPREGSAGPPRLLALGDPAYPQSVPTKALPPPPDHGLLLAAVATNGVGGLAGLKPGDVLLQYDGKVLNSDEEFRTVPANAGARRIKVKYWRNGEVRETEVAAGPLGSRYQPARMAADFILAQRSADAALTSLTRSQEWARLPGTRLEVESITQLFPKEQATTMLGAQATESAVQRMADSGELKKYRYLHFATHGRTNPSVAMSSAIILAPDPDRTADFAALGTDGQITAQQIVNTWDLDADLVVLSACETGPGRYAGGEGYLGFTQALFVKGTRSVVLSLWKVDDRATALLMKRFYQNLFGKRDDGAPPMPKAQALSEAKLWLRTQSAEPDSTTRSDSRKSLKGEAKAAATKFDHPYYWAGFILIGDPN
jgi:tetratricopeptide (TPR) repeat protein